MRRDEVPCNTAVSPPEWHFVLFQVCTIVSQSAAYHDTVRRMCDPDMCRFVDTGVHRHKAAQHLGVGGIDDGIQLQSCDVPLPDGDLAG